MKLIFMDTNGWIALSSKRDQLEIIDNFKSSNILK
jgi:hypothetical protein